MKYYLDGKCAVIVLTEALLKSVDQEDRNGIAAIPRQVEGVEVGIVIKETPNGWKASLRSNSTVDVQAICGLFGGGGHEKAAGCSFSGCTSEEAAEKLVEAVKNALGE